VDARGTVLGQHRGLPSYTIGQRRGLGLATARPLYVTALDAERNTVIVGGGDELEVDRLWAERVNLISVASLDGPLAVTAKIRHSHVPAPAVVTPASRPGALEVRFDTAQRAPAPGQSIVFYQGDLVVGGGVIARAAPEAT
jgi:tRNA-specific 2-thiouridylase